MHLSSVDNQDEVVRILVPPVHHTHYIQPPTTKSVGNPDRIDKKVANESEVALTDR